MQTCTKHAYNAVCIFNFLLSIIILIIVHFCCYFSEITSMRPFTGPLAAGTIVTVSGTSLTSSAVKEVSFGDLYTGVADNERRCE